MDSELRREIILDNYNHPFHRQRTEDNNYIKINTNNVSCIDNIDLYLLIEDNIIKDIKYEGEACVISISSTSILIKNLIGKTIEEGLLIIDNYHKMINEQEYDKDILKDLIVYEDISKQPSRIKCATLTSMGIEKVLNNNNHKR